MLTVFLHPKEDKDNAIKNTTRFVSTGLQMSDIPRIDGDSLFEARRCDRN
jgi:hypothetical protein